ncbi:hypothetical protein PIB30_028705 [Stylosanthes scabra]|uniref:Uncharacterized protein n=1 Tax=Stylosanthes scabra TaxID=79078 RepID=A0ABU6U9S9_9FABA|nr:hypothetical protein [Stylosanthes scabra]
MSSHAATAVTGLFPCHQKLGVHKTGPARNPARAQGSDPDFVQPDPVYYLNQKIKPDMLLGSGLDLVKPDPARPMCTLTKNPSHRRSILVAENDAVTTVVVR